MSTEPTPTPVPLWTRNLTLIMTANLFTFLGFQMLMPVMPVYATTLGGGETWAGVVTGIFTASAVIMRPLAGRLLDSRGRLLVFLAGLGVFIASTLSYAATATILALVVVRFLHGFGWGALGTASNTIATDNIPKARLGEGMGYFGMTSTLAMAVGPALGLALLNSHGFPIVFTVSAALVACTVALALLIRYPPQPVAPPRGAFLEKQAMPAAVLIFCATLSWGAVVSFIALYAAERGIDNIGPYFMANAISILFVRAFVGRLADRKGDQFVLYPAVVSMLIALMVLTRATSLPMFLVAGACYGLGFGALHPVLQAMAVRNVIPQRRGAANATFFVGFDLGIGLGSFVWGVIAEATSYPTVYLLTMAPVFALILVHRVFSRATRPPARQA